MGYNIIPYNPSVTPFLPSSAEYAFILNTLPVDRITHGRVSKETALEWASHIKEKIEFGKIKIDNGEEHLADVLYVMNDEFGLLQYFVTFCEQSEGFVVR